MKIKWNDKYLTVSAYAVITFFVCVMIVLVIYKMPSIIGVIGDFFSSIAAVLWGFVFAYLLNPVMVRIEKLLHKLLDRKTPHPRLCRSASALISVLLGLGVIAALIAIIVPQMFESIQGILNNMNLYMENIYKWINKLLENSPDLAGYANNAFDQLRMSMMNVLNNIGPNLAEWGSRIKAGATGIIGGIGNFVIGFIVAIYFLIDKDKFLAQG